MLRGDGFVSFFSCYFSNDLAPGGAAIEVERGKVQIENSTFDAVSTKREPGHSYAGIDSRRQQTSIHLGPDVKSAIILGNNGYYGVSLQNEIGGKAIISNNEPQRSQPTE